MESVSQAQETATPGDHSLRRIGIIDIFGAITVVALLLAVFAPWLREMEPQRLWWFLGLAALQWSVAVVVFLIQSYRKRSIERTSGKRLGIGHQSQRINDSWPKVQTIMTLVIIVIAQLCISFTAATLANIDDGAASISYVYAINSIQLGMSTGWVLFSLLSGIYGSAALFYENGVSFQLSKLQTWDQLELRHSTVFEGRVVIVTQGLMKNTLVFQVPAELRTKLIEMGKLPQV
ncbi:MAG: hypothetical protein AAF394_08485 [Planctomycetota bacterium]